MYDVFGLGNPLLDAIIKIDEKHFLDLNLKKGTMNLVDEKTSSEMLKKFKNHEVLFLPGGDVVNTVMGITKLGGKAVFCGKIGLDKHGLLIEETMKKNNVKPVLVKGDKKTGSVISLVTPDYERTFITNLGAAITLKEEELIVDDVKNSKILYLTGYFLEDKNLRNVAIKALKEAKNHGKTIVIDLSDSALIKRCKDNLKKIVIEFADILITNEDEALALTNKKRKEALHEMAKLASIAVIKIGKKGALIKEGKSIYNIPGFKVNAIDSTGAGDVFVAGLLFGLTHNYTTEQAGLIANFAASKVVQELGGSLRNSLKDDVKKLFD